MAVLWPAGWLAKNDGTVSLWAPKSDLRAWQIQARHPMQIGNSDPVTRLPRLGFESTIA